MSATKRAMEAKTMKRRQRRYGNSDKAPARADWRTVSNTAIVAVIQAAAEVGGALRFGVSRDGGAYALGVYGDGPDVYTLYAGDASEMEEHITHLSDIFYDIAIEEGIAENPTP